MKKSIIALFSALMIFTFSFGAAGTVYAGDNLENSYQISYSKELPNKAGHNNFIIKSVCKVITTNIVKGISATITALQCKALTKAKNSGTYVKFQKKCSKTYYLKHNGIYTIGKAKITVKGNDLRYVNKSKKGQKVIINTNGQNLTIDAPRDDVIHKGKAETVTIKRVAQNSYHGSADSQILVTKGGHIELNAKVETAVIDALSKVTMDVKQNGIIDHVDINSVFEGATEEEYPTLNIEGAVTSVELNTGKANVEVMPGAVKVPSIHIGSTALEEYEQRIAQRAENMGESTVLFVRFGLDGEIVKYEAPIKDGEHFEFVEQTKQQSNVSRSGEWFEESVTYDEDIYIWGDYSRIAFRNCKFKGNVYNMGEEQTLLRFFMCEFDNGSKVVFNNSGRNVSVSDLLPKAHFIYCRGAQAVAESCNAAVVTVAGSLEDASVLLNGQEYKLEDVEQYLDERENAKNRTIQEYEGQPLGINYLGQLMQGDKTEYEWIRLGESNVGDDGWDIEDQLSLYSFVSLSGSDFGEAKRVVHTNKDIQRENVFVMNEFTDKTEFENTVTINAPYNHLKVEGCTFKGDVVIYGIYTDVVFKDCAFEGNVTYYTDYECGMLKLENCAIGEDKVLVKKLNGTLWDSQDEFLK